MNNISLTIKNPAPIQIALKVPAPFLFSMKQGPGTRGYSVLSGAGVPSPTFGNLNDFYIDTTAWTIYGPKTILGWGLPTPLIGQQGIPGPQGLPGNSTTKTAGAILSAQRVVFIDTNGKAYYADKDTLSHVNKVLGLTLSAAISDALVNIQTFGVLQDPSFSFDMTKPIYLGNNGNLSQVYPTSGFVLQIGYPVAVNAIMIELQMPIILN